VRARARGFGVANSTITNRESAIVSSLPESGSFEKEAVFDSDFAFLSDRYDWQPDGATDSGRLRRRSSDNK
jgi:hypothetical protein